MAWQIYDALRASLRTVAGFAGNGLARKDFERTVWLPDWGKRGGQVRLYRGSRGQKAGVGLLHAEVNREYSLVREEQAVDNIFDVGRIGG